MELHYSDKVKNELKNKYGWGSRDSFVTVDGISENRKGGALNPKGRVVLSASFCERARYFILYAGFQEIKCWDCRDKDSKEIAEEINNFAFDYIDNKNKN